MSGSLEDKRASNRAYQQKHCTIHIVKRLMQLREDDMRKILSLAASVKNNGVQQILNVFAQNSRGGLIKTLHIIKIMKGNCGYKPYNALAMFACVVSV